MHVRSAARRKPNSSRCSGQRAGRARPLLGFGLQQFLQLRANVGGREVVVARPGATVTVDGRAAGAIEIADTFSLVEVPGEMAEDIIAALKATSIRGKKVPVRRDRDA